MRRAVLGVAELDDLRGSVARAGAWPVGSHRFGQYAERTPAGDVVCRTENVSACDRGVATLVGGVLAAVAADALGRRVEAFKDKVNYKQPGGAGFRPHQDVLAYPGVASVLSVLVAVDECTVASGCLWVAPGVDATLPTDGRGVVSDPVASALTWVPVELAPGDALCIDGLLPHFSEANRTVHPRRVLVASYAPLSEGYGRDRYYVARGLAMQRATEADGHFRISALADFAGIEATGAAGAGGPPPAAARCSHP